MHGHTADQARAALDTFILECREANLRCVRVIHGKGNRSQSGPVIKPLVATWLERRKDVLAFCTAPANDGGSGALYLLLAKA